MLVLLQLYKFQLSKRIEEAPNVFFGKREMDIADVETVVRNAVGLRRVGIGVAGLTVLLCFGELNDDGNGKQLLPGETDGFLDGFFVLELDVSDAERSSVDGARQEGRMDLPFGAVADSVLHNLSLHHFADLLEEVLEFS